MDETNLTYQAHDTMKDALTYLCGSKVKSFYARVINALEKVAVPGIGTMGVTQVRGRYMLMYDPAFAVKISHEELLATLEHECYHIILGHLIRFMQLRATYGTKEDKALFDMTSNIAADLAANQLLLKDYPDMADTENKPLGYWVLPEEFTPAMPPGMDYESYHKMTLEMCKQRLSTPPNKLWEMAQQILNDQKKKLQDALNKAAGTSDEQKQGDKEEDDEQSDGKSPDNSQKKDQPGSAGGTPQQPGGQAPDGGQGQGQGQQEGHEQEQQSSSQDAKSSLDQQIEDLDPVDRKVLEMIVKAGQSHMGWEAGADKADATDSHKLKNHGKELIKSTLKSHKKSRGTIPSHLAELIRKMLMPPVVPWTDLLHQVVLNTRQKKPKRGMRRANKKLAAMKVWATKAEEEGRLPPGMRPGMSRKMSVFPGTSYDKKFTIVYALDTSGSMSTRDLQKGLSELQHIQKSDPDVKIIVMYIDAAVAKEYVVGPNDELDLEMAGRGGTDFEPGFLRVKELLRSVDQAPDILIYATDGYCPAPETRLPIPTVWLITPHGKPVTSDAGHITIEMRDKHLGDSSEYDEVA